MVSKKANCGEEGGQSSAPTTHIQIHTEVYILQIQIHTHIIHTSHIAYTQQHHVKLYTVIHFTLGQIHTNIDTHTDRDTHITHT